MLSLDEAIKHCEEKAKEQRDKAITYLNGGYSSQIDGKSCLKCAEEHEQLAGWLKELAEYQKLFESPKEAEEVLNMLSV